MVNIPAAMDIRYREALKLSTINQLWLSILGYDDADYLVVFVRMETLTIALLRTHLSKIRTYAHTYANWKL